MKCRICNSDDAETLGKIRPYIDFSIEVFDCRQCGCRFTHRDETVYEQLHAAVKSTYTVHNAFAETAVDSFEKNDINNLRKTLSSIAKNKHIIDAADNLNQNAHVLEVGCSLGYLTSYFIARGYKVIGTDISSVALGRAENLFGPHFFLVNAPEIEELAPYDFIYHAGTIGCVDDPIGLTQYWLSLLKPNGVLVFNAPNKALADSLGKTWPFTTAPPDLVTLFPSSFWANNFSQVGDVSVEENFLNQQQAILFRYLPVAIMRRKPFLFSSHKIIEFTFRIITFIFGKIVAVCKPTTTSRIPAEFGVMVTIRKEQGKLV